MKSVGKVCLVGTGPGDPELLTFKALRMIQEADSIVYDRLVSPEIVALAPVSTEKVCVGKSTGFHPISQQDINKILVRLATEGKNVARLKGGDPMIFGRGSEETAYLSKFGIPFEISPGITAAQGAAMSSGVPLTHRGVASSVRFVSGHRQSNDPLTLDWESFANEDTTIVVYMGVANIDQISRRLIAGGLKESTPVLAIANATTPHETKVFSQLGRIFSDIRNAELTTPAIFIIGRVVSLCGEFKETDSEISKFLMAETIERIPVHA